MFNLEWFDESYAFEGNLEWFDESYAFEGVTLFRTVILSLIILLVVYMQYFKRASELPTSSVCYYCCSILN